MYITYSSNVHFCAQLSFHLTHAVLQDPATLVSASQTPGKPESDDNSDDNSDDSDNETRMPDDLSSALEVEDTTAAEDATLCAVCGTEMISQLQQEECTSCGRECHEACVQDCERYEGCAGYTGETHEHGAAPRTPGSPSDDGTDTTQTKLLPEVTREDIAMTHVVDDSACPIMNGDVKFTCIECFWAIIDVESYSKADFEYLRPVIDHSLRSNFHDGDGRPWKQRADEQDLGSYRELMQVMRNKYKPEENIGDELEDEEGPKHGSTGWKVKHAEEDMERCNYAPKRIFQSSHTPVWVASDEIQELLGRENSTSFQNRPHTDHHAESPGNNWSSESIQTYKNWKRHKITYQNKFWSADKKQIFRSLSKIPHPMMIDFVVDMANTYNLSFGQATFTAYSLYRNKVTENNMKIKAEAKERERLARERIESLEQDRNRMASVLRPASEVFEEQASFGEELKKPSVERLFAQFQQFMQRTNQGPKEAEQPAKKKRRKKMNALEPEITPTDPSDGSDATNNSNELPGVKKLGMLPLAVIVFYQVSGGPFGIETTVRSAGNLMALLGFLLGPFVWSLPEALLTAELASAFPEAGAGV